MWDYFNESLLIVPIFGAFVKINSYEQVPAASPGAKRSLAEVSSRV
jgi:hypothetical protein